MSGVPDTGLLPAMSRADKARLILRALEQDRSDAGTTKGAGKKPLAAALSDLLRDIDSHKKKPDVTPPSDNAASTVDLNQPATPAQYSHQPETSIAPAGPPQVTPDLCSEHPAIAAQVIALLPTEQAAAILRQMPCELAQRIVLALDHFPADKAASTTLSKHAGQIIRSMT